MPDFTERYTKQEALAMLFEKWSFTPAMETVPVASAAGRVTAEDIFSLVNVPVVRSSAMDGVAINYSSIENKNPDTAAWRMGREYVRADTGDDFDDAYDTVVRIEDVKLLPEGGLEFTAPEKLKRGQSIRPCGSSIALGEKLASAGTVLGALDMAAIASGGHDSVRVLARPRVGFIPTGSELVPVGTPLERGQAYDANSIMVAQLVRDMGAEPVLHPIVRDDRAALSAAFDEMLPQCDILLVNAGTSKGGEDYGTLLLAEKGELLLHGIKAVPGRPMGIAIADGKPVINLSGPTAAAIYGIDWALRPMVCRALGITVPVRRTVQATLTAPLNCPPKFCMMSRLELTKQADGALTATPLAHHGPNTAGSARVLTAPGIYISTPREPPKAAGEQITVELVSGID